MHEDSVTQQYYIATKSSPADDRARVLKYGRLFSVFDHLGDIQTCGLGEQGLFFEGTRHLSEFLLRLWDARPFPLSSTIETNNFLFSAHLTNLDVSHLDRVVIPRGTFHLRRSKFLWHDVSYEEFAFVNYGPFPLRVPFGITFGADFADIFEVRGMHRQKKGRRLEDQVERDLVLLSYEGLDKEIHQTRIQCDPAPKSISSSELQFEVHLQPAETSIFRLAISCDSRAALDSVGYCSAIISVRAEHKKASETFPQICSSNSRFSDWIRRSVADVMTIGNPEVNYPYAGVPWFSTVFGASNRDDDVNRAHKATQVFKEIMDTPDRGIPQELLESAKCIAIIPGDVKFAFISGGNYERGLATCRTEHGWSAPMFVAVEGGSVGYQIGGSSTDLVMLFMNDHALQSLLSDKFKLGADASVAAGPVGRHAAADTDLKLRAEVLSYSRSKGVFAGVSLDGAVVQADKSGDQAMYGDRVNRNEILAAKVPVPESARPLLREIDEYANAAKAGS